MRSAVWAFALTLSAAGVNAGWLREHGHKHVHKAQLEEKRGMDETSAAQNETSCNTVVCQTFYTTIYGAPTLIFPPEPSSTSYSSINSTSAAAASSLPTLSSSSSSAIYVAPTSSVVPVSPSSSSSSSSIVPVTSSSSIVISISTSTSESSSASETSSAGWGGFLGGSGSSGSGSSSSSAAAASPSSSGSISSSGGGNHPVGSCNTQNYAMTYSPYNSDGSCRSADDVASDLQSISEKGFCMVRLYSTDCSGLDTVGAAARTYGLQLMLGIYIDSSGISGAQSQVSDMVSWGQWDLVTLVIVGNEAVFSGYCSASELVEFIGSCRSTFASAGYEGWLTTAEPMEILEEYADTICPALDIAGSNIHPFFNSAVTASGAGSFVSEQLDILDGLCEGLTGINLETGWPSAGECNGVACPGTYAQSQAVSAIAEAAGDRSVMFSFVNDMWKSPGEFDCEQSWGLGHLY